MESNVLLARESIIISITHLILEVLAPPTQSTLDFMTFVETLS